MKGLGTTATTILFIASSKEGFSGSTQNGYALRFGVGERIELLKITNGVSANVALSATTYIGSSTWYSIRVTRSVLGSFKAYVCGGAYLNWTLVAASPVFPAIENTYKTSEYIVIDANAWDCVTNFRFYSGVVAP